MKPENKNLFFFLFLVVLVPLLYRISSQIFNLGFLTQEVIFFVASLGFTSFAALFLLTAKKGTNSERPLGLVVFDIAFILFILIHFVSISQAINPTEALFTALRVLMFGAIFYSCRILLSRENNSVLKSKIFTASLISTILLCFLSFVDLSAIAGKMGISSKSLYEMNKTFGHKNPLSVYLILLSGFNILAWFQSVGQNKRGRKNLFAGALIAQFFFVFFLQSRTAWLGSLVLLLMIFGGMFFISRKKKFTFSVAKLAGISAGVLGLFALLMVLSGGFSNISDRFTFNENQGSRSMGERFHQWDKTVDLIKENPVLGVGADNWKISYLEKGLDGLNRAMDSAIFVQPHNDFLWIFSETGIVGILCYLFLFLFIAVKSIQVLFSNREENEELEEEDKINKLEVWVLFSVLVSYAVMINFTSCRLTIEHQILVVLIMAILIDNFSKAGLTKQLVKVSSKLVLIKLLVFALICTGLYFVRLQNMNKAKSMIASIDKTQYRKALKLADSINPLFYNMLYNGNPIPYFKGIAHTRSGKPNQVLDDLNQALEINPFHTRSFNMYGDTYFKQKDYDTALIYYQKALAINPKYDAVIFDVARAYINKQEYGTAREWLDKTRFEPQEKQKLLQVIERYDR